MVGSLSNQSPALCAEARDPRPPCVVGEWHFLAYCGQGRRLVAVLLGIDRESLGAVAEKNPPVHARHHLARCGSEGAGRDDLAIDHG